MGAFASATAQFDRLPWLGKAICGNDFRRARAAGRMAGFLTTQDTTGIERELTVLDVVHDLGARVIGLTYNQMNYVGSGCTDRADGGVSDFGALHRAHERGRHRRHRAFRPPDHPRRVRDLTPPGHRQPHQRRRRDAARPRQDG
jgi:hypothetical protein